MFWVLSLATKLCLAMALLSRTNGQEEVESTTPDVNWLKIWAVNTQLDEDLNFPTGNIDVVRSFTEIDEFNFEFSCELHSTDPSDLTHYVCNTVNVHCELITDITCNYTIWNDCRKVKWNKRWFEVFLKLFLNFKKSKHTSE